MAAKKKAQTRKKKAKLAQAREAAKRRAAEPKPIGPRAKRPGKKRSGGPHPKSAEGRGGRKLGAMLWTERELHHRIGGLVLIGIAIFGLLWLVAPGGPPPLSSSEQETKQFVEKLDGVMNPVSAQISEMRSALEAGVPQDQAGLDALAASADRWGYDISQTRRSLALLELQGMSDRDRILKEFFGQSPYCFAEAAEDLMLLKDAPPELRPALFEQAKRLVAMGDSASSSALVTIAAEKGVDWRRIRPNADRLAPAVPDLALAAYPNPGPVNTGDPPVVPGIDAGLAADEFGLKSNQPIPDWERSVKAAFDAVELSITMDSYAEQLKTSFGADFAATMAGTQLQMARFVQVGNDVAASLPPVGRTVEYSSLLRGARTFAEAVVVNRVGSDAPAIRDRMFIKVQRLMMFARGQWTWPEKSLTNLGFGGLQSLPNTPFDFELLVTTPWKVEPPAEE